MPGEQRFQTYSRLRYFDGLFLRATDFDVEQAFHLATRRYVNYLLFNAGRLHTTDATQPLTVSHVAGTTVRVSRGAALIRDSATEAGHEVHLAADEDFDLASYGFDSTVDVPLQVRIDFEEEEDLVTGGAGSGVLTSGNNRFAEQAVIRFLEAAPPAGHRSVLLATLTLGAAPGRVISALTNTPERGGVRYEILSSDLLSRITTGPGPGPGPGPVTLSSIAVSGTTNVNVGATTTLVATGTFSDASSRALGAADGLVWTSGAPAVASVNATGVVSGLSAGTATISAAALGRTGSASVTVSSVVTPNIISISPFAGQRPNNEVFLTGTNLRNPSLVFVPGPLVVATETTVQLIRKSNPGAAPINAGTVTLRLGDASNQEVRFIMPPLPSGWDDFEEVEVRLEFNGTADTIDYRYRP
jgi:Bacterial Ig-like domain (group 2)